MRDIKFLMAVSLLIGCADTAPQTGADNIVRPTVEVALTLYSPAPPQIMLHAQNLEIGKVLAKCPGISSVETPPMALPGSINTINSLPDEDRPYHLPIVTTLDFITARDGTAPDWHGYDRANDDLKFVASLYDVAFGVLVFDPDIQTSADLVGKRIGVPARPSAVRWMSEALFTYGWQIMDDVEFIPLSPPQIMNAIRSDEIDAVTWNIMSETPGGYLPMIPPLTQVEDAHWVNISADTVTKMNKASPFTVERIDLSDQDILDGTPVSRTESGFISFKQGLAAWDDTPDDLVRSLVQCLEAGQSAFGAGGDFTRRQLDWPGLTDEQIHNGAK